MMNDDELQKLIDKINSCRDKNYYRYRVSCEICKCNKYCETTTEEKMKIESKRN